MQPSGVVRRQRIRDLQAKTRRADIEAHIRNHCGSTDALEWLTAAEYDAAAFEDHVTVTTRRMQLRAGTVWEMARPRGDTAQILKVPHARQTDRVYVYFGRLGWFGVARYPLLEVERSLESFAAAGSGCVSYISPDLTSWLTIDIDESPDDIEYSVRGEYWVSMIADSSGWAVRQWCGSDAEQVRTGPFDVRRHP